MKENLNEIWVYASNRPDKVARVTYNEKIKDELEKYTWTYVGHNKKKEYFKTGANCYYLHQ
ncbi:hypothetical protein [Clostridium polyendosporum]|uniref:hypothetical protein n=1 Tax=Clostridium polyendosporum TaxID=69208 RepID=UPI001BB3F760|nr:hypothetical protein [Clostridium polyendosporum]